MRRRIRLVLENAHDGGFCELVDVFLDPEHPSSCEVFARHFVAMAARAAQEEIEHDIERMPWLHDYTLLVCEGGNTNDVLLRYREG
ncbi:hypothetical protein ABT324_28045 [Saccharopolyspora sp. NPDC000359]|uniref:hypothetical protein n=1 Tax=Saccharopolyspora sp. NPDC000359 TaxID=3154251 RepID=UPI00331886F9